MVRGISQDGVLIGQNNELSNVIAYLNYQFKLLNPLKKFRYKVPHPNGRTTLILLDDDISHIEGSKGYSIYHCGKTIISLPKLTVCKQLHVVQETLNPDVFVRCSKSFIVNVNFIREDEKLESGKGGFFYLTDGTQIKYSNLYKDRLIELGVID